MKYEYKEGDHVKYIGKDSPDHIGKCGVVVHGLSTNSAYTGLEVHFTGNKYSTKLYCQNFAKIDSVEAEIDQALAVLKKHGKVEFKKNREAFAPRDVKLNQEYTATVCERYVKVGCQIIPFKAIEDVMFHIGHAREYTATGEVES